MLSVIEQRLQSIGNDIKTKISHFPVQVGHFVFRGIGRPISVESCSRNTTNSIGQHSEESSKRDRRGGPSCPFLMARDFLTHKSPRGE